MDGRLFGPPELEFLLRCLSVKVLFLNCTLTCRVNNYNFRQEEGINRRNESTKTNK